ncbi:farnesyl pyrophosphate synthase-like [Elgaria multicarinata webbii]|uniref:farnesyl pyrophosphate synthase-like n=1 Tax=Elgaria multicarinata webbii TaxID=159646 RepID=UPI002FCCD6DA
MTQDIPGKRMSENKKQAAAAGDKEQFRELFPQIVKDLTEDELHQVEVADAVARLKKVLEYNAFDQPQNCGLTVVSAFRALVGPDQQDQKSVFRALAIGWCLELFQAFFFVSDDIMDHSVTRDGHPCWYKKEGIGLDAVNDAFLLEACIYQLLKRYCRNQPYYVNLLELFLQASFETELGQALDLITSSPSQVDLNRFTEQRYKAIVKYKTSMFCFYIPVAAAMYMAGIDSEEEHAYARAILMEIGEFFQIQDDFIDCFGDPETETGTDIQSNKCSWLVVQCLKRASVEQRRLLEENYGQKDLDKVARVKQLYEELDLKAVFKDYEESSYQRVSGLITQHATHLPPQIFLDLAQKIYKRQM